MARKAKRRGLLTLLVLPPLMTALMALIWSTEFVSELENVTTDWRFKDRADTDPPPDDRIVLVGIAEQSLDAVGRWEEWSRKEHSEFLDAATYRPPQIIAYDFFFPQRSVNDPEGDLIFADTLALFPSAVTGMVIEKDSEPANASEVYMGATESITNITGDIENLLGGNDAIAPFPYLADSTWTGAVNCPPSDSDNMRRFMPLVIRLGTDIYASFVLQILMRMEEASPDQIEVILGKHVIVPKIDGGAWTIPIDHRGFLSINYRDTDRLKITDYIAMKTDIFSVEAGQSWPEGTPDITDKIVIVGQAAEALPDVGPTPYLSNDYLFRVQATALDSILRGDYLTHVSKLIALPLWLLLAWLTLFALRKAHVVLEILVPFLLVGIYIFSAFYLFESRSLLWQIVLPVAGFVLIHTTVIGDRLIAELREKHYIKGVFGSYVSPEVVDQIVDSGKFPELGGEEVDISILFSDIQGFSTFSEQLSPVELVDLMVEYLSAMTDIITEDGGTLDKYIGDAIDAMYGAPLPLDDHAYLAVVSTIRMQNKQAELREKWTSENRKELIRHMRTRIGLNTGSAVVGNMGSVTRFNYTMMGDNVNLGARCESGAKSFGVYTMITDETRKAAEASHQNILYRYLDQIVVQGRTLPVKVHEVIGFRNDQTQKTRDCIELYTNGIDHYLKMEWDKALECFEKSSPLELHQPERDAGVKTNPSRSMIDRCSFMKSSPPDPDWDGVYRMISK